MEVPDLELFSPLVERLGPIAIVGLQASGSPDSRRAEILEIGVVLVDGTADSPVAVQTLVRPERSLPPHIARLTGLSAEDLRAAPRIADVADAFAEVLRGRALLAHDVAIPQHFLGRSVSGTLRRAGWHDTRDLLALTHPDAADTHLDAYLGALLGGAERYRALEDVLGLLGALLHVAAGAADDGLRYRTARRALERHMPDSPWLALLGKGLVVDDAELPEQFIDVGRTSEQPVPFDEDAIAEALSDRARGRRHFPHYRARAEQVELMRGFVRNLAGGGSVLIEGGTGVGKSLAYLAAAIPFAIERSARGEHSPVVISTRTKLLQDQLLVKDIAAAARMLGYPELRALSIKGRANYICEKRLSDTLADGRDPGLLEEDRLTFAVLMSCARTRPAGEVGALPASLLRRHTLLRDLVHRSVAMRAEQCSREECGKRKSCPFGRRRAALANAHLIVANHDLLLRWPPDYPRYANVIADEGHELAGVADDVYALVVRPEDILERIDETFGSPATRSGQPGPEAGLLPRRERREAQKRARETRRALLLDLTSIGRGVAERASEYGELQLPARADLLFPHLAGLAEVAAARLEGLARFAEELDARAEWTFDETPVAATEGPTPVQKNADAWRESAAGLRLAFSEGSPDVVAGFERLVSPYDGWLLAIRDVSPASAFHEQFMQGLDSFAAVSASLFVGGDAFAAMGELEIEERDGFGVDKIAVPSPFAYNEHMRVVVLPDRSGTDERVADTVDVLALLARELGGRTLGLFTSLRRMNDVADRLAAELADEPTVVLAPRRAADDPASLVRRFRALPGGGVLLGARTFWQGLDIAGDDLQAVVIEKLPFEVPTELRRRREMRIGELGMNAFERYRLGKMLLYLKQMTGRLIRGEEDRGIVVIVEGRSGRGYFPRIAEAFPRGTEVRSLRRDQIPGVLAEIGLGRSVQSASAPPRRTPLTTLTPLTPGDSES
ncbi:MAG: hypothetical protein JRG92_04305 [Deltaproteobacteria bacterium]|nr:hypothetical protein [Deltaproteobacteria bacterium]